MDRVYRAVIGRWRGLVLAAFAVAAGGLALFLPRLGIDAAADALVNDNDPDLAYYQVTRADWSDDDYLVLCARRDDWFTPESVQMLAELSAELKKAPHAAELTSILTVPLLRNVAGGFPMPTFLDKPKVNLERARKELTEHRVARNSLISPDGRDVTIIVEIAVPEAWTRLRPQWAVAQGRGDRDAIARMRTEVEAARAELAARRSALIADVRRIASEWSPRVGETIRHNGMPFVDHSLAELIVADLKWFGGASLGFFTIALLVVYRRVRWVVLPIVVSLLPSVLMLGVMALLGRTLTVISCTLPLLLFVLTLPYTVYFIERYRERRRIAGEEPNADSTAHAAVANWAPCFTSCVTTIAGFASLMTSGINYVRTFGWLMAAGMAAGLAGVFLFLPSAAAPLRALDEREIGERKAGPLQRLVLRAPLLIAFVAVALLGVSVWGASRLNAETKFTNYFPRGSQVYAGLEYIDRRMGGITELEVILSSPQPDFFTTPQGLEAIAAAASYFDRVPEAGSVVALTSLMDEIRKSMPAMTVKGLAKIPEARAQIRSHMTDDGRTARVSVRMQETAPTLNRRRVLDGLRRHVAEHPKLKGVEARPTGVFVLYANMIESLLRSQRDTFLLTLGAIYLVMVALLRAPVTAALLLVAQALPVLMVLGAAGFLGVPLDIVTVMIASIAMGVGDDTAIQYAVRYRAELAASGGDARVALSRAHATVGRAIWIATSIVIAGFSVLLLSSFMPTVYFGLLTALAMLAGQFASLTVLPAFLLLLSRKGATT